MTLTALQERQRSEQMIERFVHRFEPSYRLLVYYAALPLLLTPELVNYLRVEFLRNKNIPWVAEVDLLLSDLCRQVGYELYAMDTAVRAYLLEEMMQELGIERMQEVAKSLLGYVRYLFQSNSYISQKELQAQQWAAMVYLEETRQQAVWEIAGAFQNYVTSATTRKLLNQADLARLAKITQELAPQLKIYQILLDYAEVVSKVLNNPTEVKPEELRRTYEILPGVKVPSPEDLITAGTDLKESTPLAPPVPDNPANTSITVKPERTYGLIVGIEKYYEPAWNVTGGGPANDALKFALWLFRCGVPRVNIRLCLSTLEENDQLIRESGLLVELATEQNITDIVTNFLSQKPGDLLYIFWAGHGFITSERERRLVFADANRQNWKNLDLNSLLVYLASDKFRIANHICIIDADATYITKIRGRPTNLGGKAFLSGQPRTNSQQFVLLATQEGEHAIVNSEMRTGYFSQAVREAFASANGSFPPDMKVVAEAVKQRFESLGKKQLPTYFYSRSWDGEIEEYLFNPDNIPHNIPQSQARTFVGREEEIEQLHQLLQVNDVVAITDVTGQGGVGKTELAIQYSQQYLEDYSGGCCWLNPQGTDLVTQLVDFGVVNLPDFNPPDGLSLAGQVAYCWKKWQAGKVLLIFDDVKDWKLIQPYLPPKGSRFKVLITTRQNTNLPCPSISLGGLSPDAALELLKNLLGEEFIEQKPEFAQRLSELVEYIPIGLYQIANYSRENL